MLGFTSAGAFPIKVLHCLEYLENGSPIHLQISPTNKCNAKCEFCSCRDVDRDTEIDFQVARREISKFKSFGGRAVTITGGGEPTMYRNINELIDFISSKGLLVGLVTNGMRIDILSEIDKLSWCRVSVNNGINESLQNAVSMHKNVDWAFSYVYTSNKDDRVQKFIDFSNKHNLTHIRIVNDILDPKPILKFNNDAKVIYQDRTEYERGSENCFISMLKPYLNSDGFYYPCCGVQYAIAGSDRAMLPGFRMGNSIENLTMFDGSRCDRCYYSQYNRLIGQYLSNIKHIDFV